MKKTLVIIPFLALLLTMILIPAEAKTVKTSELFKDVNLYGGERLYIVNDESRTRIIASIDESNNAFESRLEPNQMISFGFTQNGNFGFWDKLDHSKNGTIIVITNGKPTPSLNTDKLNYKAGETISLKGEYFPQVQTDITILKPDLTEFYSLSVTPTNDGQIDIPISISSTSQNGIYRISSLNNATFTTFTVSGGVTQDNPISPAPITNQTQAPTPSSTPSSNSPTISEILSSVNTSNSASLTAEEKTLVIELIKKLLELLY